MSATITVPRPQRKPEGSEVAILIRSVFNPFDMDLPLDEDARVPKADPSKVQEIIFKWWELWSKTEFLRGKCLWGLAAHIYPLGTVDYRATIALWGLGDDWEPDTKTIIPMETVDCMNHGADFVEAYIRLPDAVGDFDVFVKETVKALARIYKLSTWIDSKDI